jgi:hypothetical protein
MGNKLKVTSVWQKYAATHEYRLPTTTIIELSRNDEEAGLSIGVADFAVFYYADQILLVFFYG